MKIENKQLNYIHMAELANTTPQRFLKDAKRYETTLKKKGYKFIKEGKGKKAMYTITQDKDNIPWEEMNFKQRFKYSFDIELKYPEVMKKYMMTMKNNSWDIQYLSDEGASKIIGCKRQQINHCRKILEQKKLIIPIKYQSQATHLIYHNADYDYEIIEISKQEYSKHWKKHYFDEKKNRISSQGELIGNRIECEPEITKKINKEVMNNLQEEVGGYLIKIIKKEPTDIFYIALNELISK